MSGKKRERIPQGLRFDVFRRDNFTCVYCGASSPAVTLECDHKRAKSKGGPDTLDNLVTACFDCNRGKSAKEVDHNPAPASPSGNDPLKGLFGHSIVDGNIEWQFLVKGATGDRHAVQLFSWLDGRPTDIKFINTADLTGPGYNLYPSEKDWLRAAETAMDRRRREPAK